MEAFGGGPCPHPVLKISQYPLPRKQLRQLCDECQKVMVIEDGAPVIEGMLHGPLGPSERVLGRLTGQLPRMGELTPDAVAKAVGRATPTLPPPSTLLCARPPRLCDGCPHASSYEAILEAVKDVGPGHVFSDIGCYTLGALPPYMAINSCVDMGASISMAKGAADAGLRPVLAVIGDSTFTHSGMTPLLDAVWENSPITVVVLDNETTGMTGGQQSPATGRLESIAAGLGVPNQHIRVLEALPKHHAVNVLALKEEMAHEGISFVIARRECIQTARKTKPT
jgi:indolepyruvate ferredoxin oxidoreductase alpha subunit